MRSFADPASTDGCYHLRQGTGVWYASDQEQAAWAELFRHFTEEGVDPFEVRRRVGRVVVEGLEVLDLTSEQVRATLGLTLEDLVGDDYANTGSDGRRPKCRLPGYPGALRCPGRSQNPRRLRRRRPPAQTWPLPGPTSPACNRPAQIGSRRAKQPPAGAKILV